MKEELILGLNKLKENKGFTLMELMVIMAIIGILVVIASDMFVSSRAKAYDSAALGDGRQLLTAVMDSIVSYDDVDYSHNPEDGVRIGEKTATDGASRDPVLILSPNTKALIEDNSSDGFVRIEATLYSDGGTPDTINLDSIAGRREFYCIIDEESGTSSFSIE
ncbi:MAG: prepilin-type N-terminal cleavage/methylation domain-containing protein [Proteobacteria bacterium]|nr:prepilin-type N-terminal cleavage/methylation domain-containing protein [Pseudomonadota bacterium]